MNRSDAPQRESLHGWEAEIFKLVSRSASAEQWAEWLRVPLEHAAADGNHELFAKLSDAGASVRAGWKGNYGRTLLDAAVAGGDERVLSELLRAESSPDVDVVSTSSGPAALYRAVAEGHEAVARKLILAGANVNRRDPDDNACPIHLAAWEGRDALVAELIAAGASLNALACDDPTQPLVAEATPLMLACRAGHLPTVTTLLAAGADVSVIRARKYHSSRHCSALATAVHEGHTDVVKALLKHGADANESDPTHGWSVLHNATLRNREDVVKALLDAGADANIESDGRTTYLAPIHAAAECICNGALRLLLQRGADPNTRDQRGSMPLHLSAHEQGPGFLVTFDLLLRWGASETAVNDDGETAAEIVQRLASVRPDVEDERNLALQLLARAPADRVWRRRGWLVMLRLRVEKAMIRADRGGANGISREAEDGSQSAPQNSRMRVGRAGAKVEGRAVAAATGLRCNTGTGCWGDWVEKVVGHESDGVFRTIVGYL